jgi:hypothetical protein
MTNISLNYIPTSDILKEVSKMARMIIGVFERFFESYKALVIKGTNGWAIPFRILLIPASIFFYALLLLVIFAILLLAIFIAVPISAISKIKISKPMD